MNVNTNIGRGKNHGLLVCFVLLALLPTSVSLGISTYAGWERGGLVVERLMNVALGGVAVLCVHLLPIHLGLLRTPERIFAGAMWAISIVVVLYGQTAFFMLSTQHAGEQRASTLKVMAVTSETGLPGRSLTDIAQDVTKVSGDLASANARHCIGECLATLKVRRTILAAKLAALDTESGEAKRREVAEDRRNKQADRDDALRTMLRADPVASAVASWVGKTERELEFMLAVACAVVLEGAAIVGWLFVSVELGRDSSREETPSSREVDGPEVEAVAQDLAAAASESPASLVASERDFLLKKLHEAVMAGKLKPTQQGIRRFLRCGQPKAGSLNRQYAARFGSVHTQGGSTGNIVGRSPASDALGASG